MRTRRIVGLESEFGVATVGTATMSNEEAVRLLMEPVTSRHGASSIFLGNGGRLYLDVGFHPEYATAECDTLVDLLHQDRAGESIVADMAAQANVRLQERGVDARIVVLKNNVDAHGNSWGTHENYLVDRREDFDAFTDALVPFLVTRQLLCGAGRVLMDDGRPSYRLSQRATVMADVVSSATTRSRPMINTRDEPHANPRQFRRLHVIVGDSTICDATTMVKVASTELMLRLVEIDPRLTEQWRLADPLTAIVGASADRGTGLVELADGRRVPAVEVQRAHVELVEKHVECDDQWRPGLDLWRRIVDSLESGRWVDLAGEVDWAIKLQWLERVAERHGMGLADPRVRRLDLAYHEITDGGIGRMLERRGSIRRLTYVEGIHQAVTTPPATTRASLRGRFVREAERHTRTTKVDWTRLEASDLEHGTVVCPDPFASSDDRVDALIARMEREPRQGGNWAFDGPAV